MLHTIPLAFPPTIPHTLTVRVLMQSERGLPVNELEQTLAASATALVLIYAIIEGLQTRAFRRRLKHDAEAREVVLEAQRDYQTHRAEKYANALSVVRDALEDAGVNEQGRHTVVFVGSGGFQNDAHSHDAQQPETSSIGERRTLCGGCGHMMSDTELDACVSLVAQSGPMACKFFADTRLTFDIPFS